jgi:hypothetical protein
VYELSLDPVAEDQIKAVPQEALRPLAELFTLLETAPWSGEPFNPANPRGNMLTHAFGELGHEPGRLYSPAGLGSRDPSPLKQV